MTIIELISILVTTAGTVLSAWFATKAKTQAVAAKGHADRAEGASEAPPAAEAEGTGDGS